MIEKYEETRKDINDNYEQPMLEVLKNRRDFYLNEMIELKDYEELFFKEIQKRYA